MPKPMLRLNINELPWNTAAGFGLALGDLSDLQLNRYPDAQYVTLKEKVALAYELSPEQVTLANGSDELIWLVLSVLLKPGDTVTCHSPTFGEYERMAILRGLNTVYSPIQPDLAISLSDLLTTARRCGAKMTIICRPNNPTGECISLEELTGFLDAYGGYLMLDEAYVEFSSNSKVTLDLLSTYPNLILLRTFSKAFGLAGIRLGYSFSSISIAKNLNAGRPPFNVNAISESIALKALEHKQDLETRIQELVAERSRVCGVLTEMKLDFLPSEANFILLTNLKTTIGIDGCMLAANLKERGILVRAFTEEALKNCIRFSLGTPDQNNRLLKELEVYADFSKT